MKQYSCKRGGPRGGVTVIQAQDGYYPDGKRRPFPVEVRTEWLPINCGYLERAADPLCGDCLNRGRK